MEVAFGYPRNHFEHFWKPENLVFEAVELSL